MVFHSDILPGVLMDIAPILLAVPVLLLGLFGWVGLRRAVTRAGRLRGLGLLALAGLLGLAMAYRFFFLTGFYAHVWYGHSPHAALRVDGAKVAPAAERFERLYLVARRHSELEVEIQWKDQVVRRRLAPTEFVVNLDPRGELQLIPTLFTYGGVNFGPPPPKPVTIGLDARTAASLGCEEFLDLDDSDRSSTGSYQASKVICRVVPKDR